MEIQQLNNLIEEQNKIIRTAKRNHYSNKFIFFQQGVLEGYENIKAIMEKLL